MKVAARLLGLGVLALMAAGLTQLPGTKRIDPAPTGALTGRAVFSGAPPQDAAR